MEVRYHKIFLKKFRKIPVKAQQAFARRLVLFESNQNHVLLKNHIVDKAFPDCRSINVTGDYRAIFYKLNDTVIFMNIGTHSDLYK